jgi:hypothetical protein
LKGGEEDLLYKLIVLTESISPVTKEGMTGVILEILDSETFLSEFFDDNGNQIQFENDPVFLVKRNQFNLKE